MLENRGWTKKYTNPEDWLESGDGFWLCRKSLFLILRDAGVSTLADEHGEQLVAYIYDDWYPTRLLKRETYVDSLIKVREPGDTQGGTGTAIPFVALDGSALERELKKANPDPLVLYQTLSRITNPDPEDLDERICRYFADPRSLGSYVAADFVVEKVARMSFADDHTWAFPGGYRALDQWGRALMDQLAGKGIFDPEKGTITVADPDHLSTDEWNAVLCCTTGNTDVYSFAGENLWHAMLCIENAWDPEGRSELSTSAEGAFMTMAGAFLKKHTIASDAGVGESQFGVLYERYFKSPDSVIYKEQKRMHEDWGKN